MLPSLFGILYACANLISFVLYTFDKVSAKQGWGRIPETVLLAAALPGPFGALAAMIVFRHKTRHLKFLIVPVLAALHVVVFLLLCSSVA